MRLALYLHLSAGDARALYRALLDELFARHPTWELGDEDWRFLGNPLLQGHELDAYIGSHLPPQDLVRLAQRGIPCVFIGNPPADAGLPPRIEIDYDNAAFGRQAAALFKTHGWRSAAFYGDDSLADSRGRLAGLREGLRSSGIEPFVFAESNAQSLIGLGDWLIRLPRGTAILARSDHAALRVVAAARARGLGIPNDLGLLGIDDEDLARAFARLDLASLRRDDSRIAALAFDLIDLQLTGVAVTPGVRRIGPHPQPHLGVTLTPPRQTGFLLQRALTALHGLPVQLLTPEILAKEAACSRRTLERTFAREWHESPAQAIRRVRMEQARQLCQGQERSLDQIARSLGFQTPSNFIAAYRRFWGTAPRGSRSGQISSGSEPLGKQNKKTATE